MFIYPLAIPITSSPNSICITFKISVSILVISTVKIGITITAKDSDLKYNSLTIHLLSFGLIA